MISSVRLATAHDTEQVLAIYAPVVRATAISFEAEPPTLGEMRQRIVETLSTLPWLVAERRGEVVGYAYASPHRSRAAYRWAVDVSVYVHASARRGGVGRALYTPLLEVLALQGFYTACAGITLPNAASVGLHEALGFQPVGVYRAVGYKLGAWHDVGWWQRALRGPLATPAPPLAPAAVQRSTEWQTALAKGCALLGG